MEDRKHLTGCLICGSPLAYGDYLDLSKCHICGLETLSQCRCTEGHFVCDHCHQGDALGAIETICTGTTSQDPLEIALQVMQLPYVKMHGPEHHALVAGALVAAYNNLTGEIAPDRVLEAIRRGSLVKGGFCGTHGACGAAVGAGVAVSVIEKAAPIKREGWDSANRATAEALLAIADVGGPRCCKRCTWLSMGAAMDFLESLKQVRFPSRGDLEGKCPFFANNQQCLRAGCPFYPALGRQPQSSL